MTNCKLGKFITHCYSLAINDIRKAIEEIRESRRTKIETMSMQNFSSADLARNQSDRGQ